MPHHLQFHRLLLRSTPLPQFVPGGATASATEATAYVPSASASAAAPSDDLPTLLVFFLLVLSFLFFIFGFILRDIFQCFCHRYILRIRKRRNGIDPAVLKSFPVVPYDAVRTRCGPDCVVCLAEFESDEAKPASVRILTVCGHVFHAECIDIWLESHVTCPICRSDLRRQPNDVIMKNFLDV